MDQAKPITDQDDVTLIQSIHDFEFDEDKEENVYKCKVFGRNNFHKFSASEILDDNLLKVYHEKEAAHHANTRSAHKPFVYKVPRHNFKQADLFVNNAENIKRLKRSIDISQVPNESPLIVPMD